MTIHATAALSTIIVEDLPETGPKFALPSDGVYRGELTPAQVKSLARYAVETMEPTMVWADAVQKLRTDLLVGKQWDYKMLDKLTEMRREAHIDDDFTPKQVRLIATNTKALSGEEAHWYAPIAAKIAAAPKSVRDQIWAKFVGIENRRDLNLAMAKFSASFGEVPRNVQKPGEVDDDGDAQPGRDEGGF